MAIKALCLNKNNPYYKEWIHAGYSDNDIYQEYVLNNYFLPRYSSKKVTDIQSIINGLLPKDGFQTDFIENLKRAKGVEALGAFFKNTLYFSENADQGTVAEEAFHAVAQSLMTKEERESMLTVGKALLLERLSKEDKTIEQYKKELQDRLGLKDLEVENYLYEEEVAKQYVNFHTTGSTSFVEEDINNLASKLGGSPLAYTIAKILTNFFNKLKSILNFSKDNKIALLGTFGKIKNGAFTKRRIITNESLYSTPSFQLYGYLDDNDEDKFISPAIIQKLVANVAITYKRYKESNPSADKKDLFKSVMSNWTAYYKKNGIQDELIVISDVDLRKQLFSDIEIQLKLINAWDEDFLDDLEVKEDSVGGQDSHDTEANERNFSSYSKEMKVLMLDTGVEIQVDTPNGPAIIYKTPDPSVIYSGLVRAASNTSSQSERLRKLVNFSSIEGNENSRIFIIDKILKDLFQNGEQTDFFGNAEEYITTYKNTPVKDLDSLLALIADKNNPFLLTELQSTNSEAINHLNLTLNAFDLWSRDMENIGFNNELYSEETSKEGVTVDNYGTIQSYSSNLNTVDRVQMNIWNNSFNILTQASQDVRKKFIQNLRKLSFNKDTATSDLKTLSDVLSLNLHSKFIEDLVVVMDGGITDRLDQEDIKTLSFVKIKTSMDTLRKEMLKFKLEGDLIKPGEYVGKTDIIIPDLFAEGGDNAYDLKALLKGLAAGNIKYNESILENSHQNAEKKTIYTFQWATNTLKFVANLRKPEFISKLLTGNPYIGQERNPDKRFFSQNPITTWLNIQANAKTPLSKTILSHVKHFSPDAIKEMDISDTKATSSSENAKVIPFGSMKYRDIAAACFGMFIEKSKSFKGSDEVLVPIPMGQNESSKLFDFIQAPLIVDLLDESGYLTDAGEQRIADLIKLEVERIADLEELYIKHYSKDYNGKVTSAELQEKVDHKIDIFEKYHTGDLVIVNGKIDFSKTKIRGLEVSNNLKGYFTIDEYTDRNTVVYGIKEKYTKVANDNLRELEQENLIGYDEKTKKFSPTKSLLPKDFFRKPTKDRPKNVGFLYTTDQELNAKRNISHTLLNMWLSSTYLNQLRVGDTVLNYKNDFSDPMKRNKMDNGAGVSIASELGNAAFGLKPVTSLNFIIEEEPKATSDIDGFKYDEKEDKFKSKPSLDIADAQGTGSLELHLKTEFGAGRMNAQKYDMYRKISEGIDLTIKEQEEANHYYNVKKTVAANGAMKIKLSMATLTKLQTAIPTRITAGEYMLQATINDRGLTEHKEGESTIEVSWNLDIKNPIYYSWEAAPGMEKLNNRRLTLEGWRDGVYTGKKIDFLIHPTASKAGSKNVMASNNWGALSQNESYFVQNIDADAYKIQVENPAGKVAIYDPTQQLEITINEVSGELLVKGADGVVYPYSADKLVDVFQRYMSARNNNNYSIASDEMFDDKGNPHFSYFVEKLQETLMTSGSDIQTLSMLQERLSNPGKMRINQNMPLIKEKFIQLYFKHFTTGVMAQKVAGDALAMISPDGYTQLKRKVEKTVTYVNQAGKEQTKIIHTWEVIKRNDPDYAEAFKTWKESKLDFSDLAFDIRNTLQGNGKKDQLTNKLATLPLGTVFVDSLRHNKPRIENGQLLHMVSETLMPKWYDDSNTIEEGLRYQYGVRIPTQDKQSSVNIEWVDTLPSFLGNSIIVPKEVAQLAGSDFDIDKIYVHRPDGKFKDGVFKAYTNDFDSFKDYIFSSNKLFKKLVNKKKDADEKYVSLSSKKKALKADSGDNKKALSEIGKEMDKLESLYKLEVLKQFKLPTNELEYKNHYKEGHTGFINNQILSIKIAMLSSDSSLYGSKDNPERGIYDSPATVDQLKDLSKEHFLILNEGQYDSIRDKGYYRDNSYVGPGIKVFPFRNNKGKSLFDKTRESVQVFSPLNYFKYQDSTQIGKEGIAYSVNANLLGIVANRIGLSIDPEKVITIFNADGTTHSLGYFGYLTTDERRVFDIISTLITATTDEAKEGQLARHGINANGLKVVCLMVLYGMPLGKGIAMIQHPLVREFEKISNKQEFKTQFEKENADFVYLKEDIYKAITGEDYPDGQELNPQTLIMDEMELYFPGGRGAEVQNQVLLSYIHLLHSYESLSGLLPLIKGKGGLKKDVQGYEADMEKIDRMDLGVEKDQSKSPMFNFRDAILDGGDKSSFLRTILEEYNDQESKLEKVFTDRKGFFIEIMRILNPFFSKNKKEYSTTIRPKIDSFLIGQVIKYKQAELEFELLNYDNLDNSLFIGDNTVAKRILSAPDSIKNIILSKFKITLGQANSNKGNKKIDKTSILNLGKVSPEEQSVLSDTFDSIYSTVEGKELAKDLFRYFAVKDGLQFKANGISKAFPVHLFDEASKAFDWIMDELEKDPKLRAEIYKNVLKVFLSDVNNKKFLKTLPKKVDINKTFGDTGKVYAGENGVRIAFKSEFNLGPVFVHRDRLYKIAIVGDNIYYLATAFTGNKEVSGTLDIGKFLATEETIGTKKAPIPRIESTLSAYRIWEVPADIAPIVKSEIAYLENLLSYVANSSSVKIESPEVQEYVSTIPEKGKIEDTTVASQITSLTDFTNHSGGALGADTEWDTIGATFKWARTSENSYEVSSQGDKRFSALSAKLKDGRTIEEVYQLDIKGYRIQGNGWKLGKGKAPLRNISKEQSWEEYKALWKQYLDENPDLKQDLIEKAKGKVLTDKFASTDVSQARALAEILNDSQILFKSKTFDDYVADDNYNTGISSNLEGTGGQDSQGVITSTEEIDESVDYAAPIVNPKPVVISNGDTVETFMEFGTKYIFTKRDNYIIKGEMQQNGKDVVPLNPKTWNKKYEELVQDNKLKLEDENTESVEQIETLDTDTIKNFEDSDTKIRYRFIIREGSIISVMTQKKPGSAVTNLDPSLWTSTFNKLTLQENASKSKLLEFSFKKTTKKERVIARGGRESNDIIFETDDKAYLMNDQQQVAFDKAKEMINKYMASDIKYVYDLKKNKDPFAEKVVFEDPILEQRFKGKIPKILWDNMFSISGGGGTGKTTVAKAINDFYEKASENSRLSMNNVVFGAPTHQASTVLQESLKVDSEASNTGNVLTAASLIGALPTKKTDSFIETLEFDLSPASQYFKRWLPTIGNNMNLIILDESSMLGESFIRNIETRLKQVENGTGVLPLILFLGDAKQLPEIKKGQVSYNRSFVSLALLTNEEKTTKLTQIMRSENDFFNEIFDSIGLQIEANVENFHKGLPLNPYDLTKFKQLISKSQKGLTRHSNKRSIIEKYTTALIENINPRVAFYTHYNKLDKEVTQNLIKEIRDTYMMKLYGSIDHLGNSIPYEEAHKFLKEGTLSGTFNKTMKGLDNADFKNLLSTTELANSREFILGDYVQNVDNLEERTSGEYIGIDELNPYSQSLIKNLLSSTKDHGVTLDADSEDRELLFKEGAFKPQSRYKVIDIVHRLKDSMQLVVDASKKSEFATSGIYKHSEFVKKYLRNIQYGISNDDSTFGIEVNDNSVNIVNEMVILYNRQDKLRIHSQALNTGYTRTYLQDVDNIGKPSNKRMVYKFYEVSTGKVLMKMVLPYKFILDGSESRAIEFFLNNAIQGVASISENKSTSTLIKRVSPFKKSYVGSTHTVQGSAYGTIFVGVDNILGNLNRVLREGDTSGVEDIISSLYTALTRAVSGIDVLFSENIVIDNLTNEDPGAGATEACDL